MYVHITATPNIGEATLSDIFETLNQAKGKLVFINDGIIPDGKYEVLREIVSHKENFSLSFEQHFTICNIYRKLNAIPDNDYVVIITEIPNHDDWFSKFEGKNIFIYGEDWQYYSHGDIKYSLAYQVATNIFQSELNLDIDNENEPNIHQPSIGCINDFCEDKEDIKLKMLSGYICDNCLKKAETIELPASLILQINEIGNICSRGITDIRNRMRISVDKVVVDEHANVVIGGTKLQLDTIQRTLYIFFLQNLGGITRKEMKNRKAELYSIYQKVKKVPYPNEDRIDNLVKFTTIKRKEGTFHKNKSLIKNVLKLSIPNSRVHLYEIDLIEDEKYKIQIDPNLVYIHPSLNI